MGSRIFFNAKKNTKDVTKFPICSTTTMVPKVVKINIIEQVTKYKKSCKKTYFTKVGRSDQFEHLNMLTFW